MKYLLYIIFSLILLMIGYHIAVWRESIPEVIKQKDYYENIYNLCKDLNKDLETRLKHCDQHNQDIINNNHGGS